MDFQRWGFSKKTALEMNINRGRSLEELIFLDESLSKIYIQKCRGTLKNMTSKKWLPEAGV